MGKRRAKSGDHVWIAHERLNSGRLELGAAPRIPGSPADGMIARVQLSRQRQPTATAADYQAARQITPRRAAARTSAPGGQIAAVLAPDLVAGPLGKTACAPVRVRRLQQLIELTIGEVLLTPA